LVVYFGLKNNFKNSLSRAGEKGGVKMKSRSHIFVFGKVQGVLFRENTRKKAAEFGLSGFVRNLPNGKVEAVFEGEKEKIEKIIRWIKKGPETAQVENIEINWQDYKKEFENFKIANE
jgi:acylphosphatase